MDNLTRETWLADLACCYVTEIFLQPAEKATFKASRAQEEIASTAQKAISTRDEERAKKRRLAAHFFSRYLSSQVTCEDGWCIAFVPCPVHLVVFSLKPAADVCVVEITTRVILAVNFIRAIPAVISKVA